MTNYWCHEKRNRQGCHYPTCTESAGFSAIRVKGESEIVRRWAGTIMTADLFLPIYDTSPLKPSRIGYIHMSAFGCLFRHSRGVMGVCSGANCCSAINISLKFVPKGLINNIPAFVQIISWRRPGDKPLLESMVVILVTHMCVTRPQWVKIAPLP